LHEHSSCRSGANCISRGSAMLRNAPSELRECGREKGGGREWSAVGRGIVPCLPRPSMLEIDATAVGMWACWLGGCGMREERGMEHISKASEGAR
jgi:hypothetical protein